MTYIKPSFVENLYNTFFHLEPDRPYYYMFVVRLARSIFMSLGFEDRMDELDEMIRQEIELPLHSDFVSVIHAYYNPRFMLSKRAYTKVGDSIDYREITRYDMMRAFEKVKDWAYDRVVELSPHIRFTKTSEAMT